LGKYAWGAGDGPITDDGCAVELYRGLSADGEIEMITSLVPIGGAILDLGAGAGRLAKPLARVGFQVTAVDQSADMLAEIDGAECVQASIETLDLTPRHFEVVLLASYLLNTPDVASRSGLLRSCRRHVQSDGVVLLQVRGPSLLNDIGGSEWEVAGVLDVVEAYHRTGSQVTMTWRTEVAGRKWVQTFTHEFLDEAELTTALAQEGLRFEGWLDERREWLLAKP